MQNSDRYDPSEYIIEQLQDYDDIELVKPWQRYFVWFGPFVSISVFIAYGSYFGYRVWCNYTFRRAHGGLSSAHGFSSRPREFVLVRASH
jgi:hypothetical protein